VIGRARTGDPQIPKQDSLSPDSSILEGLSGALEAVLDEGEEEPLVLFVSGSMPNQR
jgi:hypothetical protein